ncbi:MAG TPA: radical SAM protein [Bacillota bacterium]
MTWNLGNHPCFNREAASLYGRIHLPVAPWCNIQCAFCNRSYDCANENRPGVTSAVLSPRQALHYLGQALQRDARILVVGIAGPGDPFANPAETMETLALVKENYPELGICLASNGLGLSPYVDALADSGVTHVTVTVNAVDPVIGAQIYAWVRDGRVVYRGRDAAMLLFERQQDAIRRLKQKGLIVKVNTIVIPGVNDGQVPAVAERMRKLGVDRMNCIPIYPARGTVFESIVAPGEEFMAELRQKLAKILPQMGHCARCRADASGLLAEPMTSVQLELLTASAALPLDPSESRPYVAVASMEGFLINRHLGEAEQLFIYRKSPSGFELVEKRPTPEPGGGSLRWEQLAKVLNDCRAVLVSAAGASPREILKKQGIAVVEVEGLIDQALAAVYEGKPLNSFKKFHRSACGGGCTGQGAGC